MGLFDKPIKDLKKEFEKARNAANNATNALNKAVKSAMDDIKKKVEKTADNSTKGIKKFHKELQKPLKGIDKLIKDFEDIVVTFNRSIPNRFTNVFAGIEVILKDGLGGEIKTLTDSIGSGFRGIGWLFAATGELIRTYLMCTIKLVKNLYFCLFFYLVEIIFRIIYLPVWLIMWSLKTFLGIDMFFIENNAAKGLRIIDEFFYFYFGFHVIYWPKNVRERCFVCVRLKKDTLSDIAKKVDYNFNERISKASGLKMKWAERISKKHMDESAKWPKVRSVQSTRREAERENRKYVLPPIKYNF